MRTAAALLATALIACASGPAVDPSPVTLASLPLPSLDDCPAAPLSVRGPAVVAIALDVSRSTVDPTGFDIDRDGTKGQSRIRRIRSGSMFDRDSTDPGDSFLAAQVVAANSLVHAFAPVGTRFAIVGYSGVDKRAARGRRVPSPTADATVESPPTSDVGALTAALDRILAAGSLGQTHFAPAMRMSSASLTDSGVSAAEAKIVLFVSDSPSPHPDDRGAQSEIAEATLDATDRGVVFHTFGLGDAARERRPRALAEIAEGTGGTFRPVRNATDLHCELAAAITE